MRHRKVVRLTPLLAGGIGPYAQELSTPTIR